MMLKYLFLFTGLCFSLAPMAVSAAQAAASEIYYVRHAETVGNVTHKHTRKNDRTFSSKGKQQVIELTRKLDRLRFDYILVSPKYRALNTVFPYLKKHALKAEIWPELAECCWQKERNMSFGKLRRGSRIKLEAQMKNYFTFPDAESRNRYDAKNYGQGMMQTFMATEKMKQRFAGSGKTILVIGHYHAGARVIEILQGIEPVGGHKLSNAKIHHLRENSDGSFALISSNQ
ncbi:MAG: histidine phosphatase family protein [Mariprofundus sp.]